ncbi:MAG: exodeoxyribonuclease VII large subunit [Betaproteobacteria bacterium]|nr:exodeoxyribonuclease VII large subunit [Betaproteobacteria bacterium]
MNDDAYPLFANSPAPRGNQAITVSALNRRARNLLESEFSLLWVAGEISNLVRAASGHWYFSLKDDSAQIRCVMFRNRASVLTLTPENGMQVEVRALPSLYEPRGEFQLGVETMRRAGLGALFEAFERLKAKLANEGLFEEARKRPLPAFPRAIGIVTSPKAAALRDVITTLRRRAPMIDLILYPCSVQGATAAQEIAAAIDSVRLRGEVEVLIICRGGGSIEDLWSFNEEIVARAVVRLQTETTIPVVSGVGHETDFTICDFVADRRAPTPTAAAELVSPDRDTLLTELRFRQQHLRRSLRRVLEAAQQRLDRATHRLLSPSERLARERDRLALLAARVRHAQKQQGYSARHQLNLLAQRFEAARPRTAAYRQRLEQQQTLLQRWMARHLEARRSALQRATQALRLLSPDQVLSRGYSIVTLQGEILRDSAQVLPGEMISVQLAAGRLQAEVKELSQ